MPRLRISGIVEESIVDGPGLRYVVFTQGCPHHCPGCHNPQTHYFDGGEFRDTDDILRQFMENPLLSGITFSGGEPLLQQEFATALARSLHENGVSVAIETAAAVPAERFREFLREVDYVHIDLKHYDSARHRAGTGMGNEQILENICAVRDSGLPHLVRIPVIPGFNDALEDAEGFAKLLVSLGIKAVQLLPFHQMGEKKYSLLGREYAHAGQAQLHREDLEQYRQTMLRHGLDARF